ncbi:GNAT family N-acetyltransferase [Micromonospora craterilacus]|uniref:GNAT family N-acetyltransferase n=1 Tax=Micromonospora craterilacus TaxID=1655439 RepID=A0A2W2F457_9ACTN|nr:GNAT family protein [Micromonospora craterilacus]PZG23045.1 GNAT family N-acetyltransferase [Micromonospora craterilacus]
MLTPDLPLKTERLELRPFRPSDLADLHGYFADPAAHRYLYSEAPADLDGTRAVLARRQERTALRDKGDAIQLAAVLRRTGQLVGDVVLAWAEPEHRQGEIGYLLHPDHRGHGYATEAATAMLALAFDRFDLHRVVGRLDARNTASARVLERLGMRREAHLRENEFVKGEWADEVIYAMLARDWRAR